MKRFGKGAPAAPPPPAPSANVTMPNAAPGPGSVMNMKPVDVPVDKLAAPVAISPPPPDANVVPVAPESSEEAAEPGKGGSKFNKFLKKPKGRFLKGFRRADDKPAALANNNADVTVLPGEPAMNNLGAPAISTDPTLAEKKKIRAERHAAQVAEYEERLDDWNAEFKRKKNQNELMNLTFDPETEMRPKPTPPAPLEDSDDETVPAEEANSGPAPAYLGADMQKRVSSFRPINTPVVVEGQKASQIAEMFAAKAYGGAPAAPVHPTAAPVHGHANPTSISMASMFSVAGPILPPGASMHAEIPPQHAMQHPGPQPGMTAQYAHPPPNNAYQPAGQAFTPHVPQSQYAPPMGVNVGMADRGMQIPQVQSNTYVDPGLAEKIRRGREMTKLGIRSEESGNMGSAKEAYMKALELLIPAIPMLDHGNDVSYTFRMNEKRKLNREAGLTLDRCEEIKKFLDGEVAALNTRNLLESAQVPRIIPKQPSVVRQEFNTIDTSNDYDQFDNGEREGGSGDVGLAKRPAQKKKEMQAPKLHVPKAPPPPPSNLLDGFSSMGLGDPLSQQAHPRAAISPAPLPAPLPKSTLHRRTGSSDDRQQAMSRPPMNMNMNNMNLGGHPGGIPPSPPAFPETPPGLQRNQSNGPKS